MKKLLYIILLLPLWVNAQTNGTIQKTSATGTIRGSFGSLGLDTLPRVTGALVDGWILKYHAATNKWYASPDAEESPIVNVESFRNPALTDDEFIQNAINFGGNGAKLYFADTTYTISNTLLLDSAQSLIGRNTTFKRANQTTTTLTVAAPAVSTTLTVASVPTSWKIGDDIQVYTDSTQAHAIGRTVEITNIVGTVITITPAIGNSYDETITTWSIGATVRKVYPLLTSEVNGFLYNSPISIIGITFDGNKVNNTGNYNWFVNSTMFVGGFGSIIQGNNFINSPNETVVGHGFYLDNNYFKNLNGSAVHLSGSYSSGYQKQNAWITNNFADSTNLISTTITGHSEGAITLSNQGGWFTMTGNRFYNGGESVLGFFQSTEDANTHGADRIVATGNLFTNFTKIIYDFEGTPVTTPKVNKISANTFDNCGVNDWGVYSLRYGIDFSNNKLMGGTTVTSDSSAFINTDSLNVLIDGSLKIQKTLPEPSGGFEIVTRNNTGGLVGSTALTSIVSLTGAVTSVGNATSLGSFSSADLRGALTDETGTGVAVFATSPTLVTPVLGVASATTITSNRSILNSAAADPVAGDLDGTFIYNPGASNNFSSGLGATSGGKVPIYFKTGSTNGGGFDFYQGTTKIAAIDYLGNISATNLASGTYTPTLTNTTNVSSSTAYVCQYSRIGNIVHLSGSVSVTPTASGSTVVDISIPIASNFSDIRNVTGSVSVDGAAGSSYMQANTTNDRMVLTFSGSAGVAVEFGFSITYIIL